MAEVSVAIVGSRTFSDYALVVKIIDRLITQSGGDLVIVSGGASGADSIAEDAAHMRLVPVTVILPDWNKFGKSAGFRRNKEIIASADRVIALFGDGPRSKGTQHSVNLAIAAGKLVHIYHEGRWESIPARKEV